MAIEELKAYLTCDDFVLDEETVWLAIEALRENATKKQDAVAEEERGI